MLIGPTDFQMGRSVLKGKILFLEEDEALSSYECLKFESGVAGIVPRSSSDVVVVCLLEIWD